MFWLLVAQLAIVLPGIARTQDSVDGVYSGNSSMSQSWSGKTEVGTTFNCPSGGPVHFVIKDGAFHDVWAGKSYMVTVKPDGTFDQPMGNARIFGKVADGKLNFTAESRGCHYTYQLSK